MTDARSGFFARAVVPSRGRLPRWLADAIAAFFIVSTAFVPFPIEELRTHDWLFVAIFATLPAVVLRRRWPIAALDVCLGLFAFAALFGTLSPAIVLAASICLFGVMNRYQRGAGLVLTAVSVAVVLLSSIPAAPGSVFDPRVFQFAVTLAFAAAAGDGTRTRREYVQAIVDRAERAERTRDAEAKRQVSEERLRIARDLHDAVAHQIAVISLNAGVASSALENNPDRAKTALGTVRQAARTVLGEIGDLMAMLRADEPTDSRPAPQAGADSLESLLEQFRASGLDVHARVEGDVDRLGGAVGLVAYRVIQEALTNAHKHGAEQRAHLLLAVEAERVEIVVTNPLPPDADDATGFGVGIIGLRERVASVRGAVTAGPVGGSWRLDATLPLTKTTEEPR